MNRKDFEFFCGDELTQADIDFIFEEAGEKPREIILEEASDYGTGDYKVAYLLDGEGAIFQAVNVKTGKRYGCCYSVAAAHELCKQLNADDQLAKLGF